MISGRTAIIAHLGVPTENFRSPMIYNPWFEAKGIDAVVVPMGCEAEDFRMFLPLLLRLRNINGALITMPHKAQAAELLDVASASVKVCGACNAVKRGADGRLIGNMFDGDGFVRSVLSKGRTIRGASALVVGCGGAGSAIAASLADEGAARLRLFDVDADAARKLARRLGQHFPANVIETGSNDPTGFDIVVNATPLGMRDSDPMPFDADRLDPSALVGEAVMRCGETPLLAAARARGCMTQAGSDMLFEQIPAYLAFFGYPTAAPDELRRLAALAE